MSQIWLKRTLSLVAVAAVRYGDGALHLHGRLVARRFVELDVSRATFRLQLGVFFFFFRSLWPHFFLHGRPGGFVLLFFIVHRGSLETLHKLWAASSSKVLLIESESRQTLPRLYQKVQVTEVKGKSFWISRPAPDTHREAGSQEEACEGPQNSSTCSKSQQWQACLT